MLSPRLASRSAARYYSGTDYLSYFVSAFRYSQQYIKHLFPGDPRGPGAGGFIIVVVSFSPYFSSMVVAKYLLLSFLVFTMVATLDLDLLAFGSVGDLGPPLTIQLNPIGITSGTSTPGLHSYLMTNDGLGCIMDLKSTPPMAICAAYFCAPACSRRR